MQQSETPTRQDVKAGLRRFRRIAPAIEENPWFWSDAVWSFAARPSPKRMLGGGPRRSIYPREEKDVVYFTGVTIRLYLRMPGRAARLERH